MPPSKKFDTVSTNANDHALELFKTLPEPLPSICLEICQTQGIQPWHLFAGHFIKADQQAGLHAPILLPEWTEQSETPIVGGPRRCRACRQQMEKTRQGAEFCCNYCGSGRFAKEHVHHRDCEFFIKPTVHLTGRGLMERPLLPVAPEDPEERRKYEEEAFERHLAESQAAENSAGGLPDLPDMMADPSEQWATTRR
jgi:hypothetical protein